MEDDVLTITAFDSGALGNGRHADSGCPTQVFVGPIWVSMTDNHDSGGNCDIDDVIHRNYFKFDLSDISGTVVNAELVLEFPDGAFNVDRDSLNFAVREVSSPYDSFGFDFDGAFYIPFSQSVWDDFGSGTTYGSRQFSEADEGTTVTIQLNEDAVAAINNSLGDIFSMAGQVASGGYGSLILPPGNPKDFLFQGTGAIETDLRFDEWWTTRDLRLFFE